ncbi:MAG: radical SAM protein [Treponema sp.]|nr:radical SAM protein [Treponema sp.]
METVPRADPFVFRPEDFSFHSRAFLKIQDGCNQGCSFCRSVLARGKSRSLNADEALERLRALEEGGFAEAVITGLNIGQYRDPGRGLDLGGLLRFLLEGTARITLRLSALEPDGLGGGFFELLSNRRIRPHFHLSVQSGSQAVLNRMGRRYSPADIEALTAEFRRLKDDPFLAADIIAGFPGETPEDFKATLELCERTGFAWIHAFPYSPRPGTPAYDFGGRVGNGEAASRVEALLDLARRGRAVYIGRWLGRTVEAVVRAGGLPPGFDAAVSENYLNLLLRREPGEGPLRPGARLRCRIAPLPELPGAGRFDAAGLACVC